VLPPGYLKAAYQFVREAGGICIADEVQVGFGRVGSHFWGFQTQDVVPDIVTMGKPMGNGHPIGAVVTTPEIAQAFNNGMEYFNTFGGNPVSCSIGIAVLDIIEQTNLQAHALETGNYLLAQLNNLLTRHEQIGDIRGLGLFIGIEIVSNKQEKTPRRDLAKYIVERMKDHGILLSTDGPKDNVIKIKPPLVFDKTDAMRLIQALERILVEDFVVT
jgi:4-aminobutyrate aminotransferase-like enzyme